MKVWITKYALTRGIIEAEVELLPVVGGDSCVVRVLRVADNILEERRRRYVYKPYWHLSLGEAQQYSLVLRDKKIAALKRQTAKLEKLEFK